MQTVEQVKEALREARPVRSLAALVWLGIEDGRAMLDERPHVRPDYTVWYRAPSFEEQCTACLAGGIILGTLAGCAKRSIESTDLTTTVGLDHTFERNQVRALIALDRARQGNFDSAYRALGLWERPYGTALSPERVALRNDVIELTTARRKRTGISAPDGWSFMSRATFETHLDALGELAEELERLEATHADLFREAA